jgi:RimJ/RimL family protein N-acetyltransferase
MGPTSRVYAELDVCRVRDLAVDDATSIAHHVNDRRIWIGLRDRVPYPYALEDAERFLALACAAAPRTAYAIDVDGVAIGCIGLELHGDIERISAEIGYWLGVGYWGRGIATAAVRAVTRHALDSFGLCRVYALPFAHNVASCRVLDKAGYLCEGRLRRSVVKDGKVLDQLLYAFVDEARASALAGSAHARSTPSGGD